jgi:hypothetical protein
MAGKGREYHARGGQPLLAAPEACNPDGTPATAEATTAVDGDNAGLIIPRSSGAGPSRRQQKRPPDMRTGQTPPCKQKPHSRADTGGNGTGNGPNGGKARAKAMRTMQDILRQGSPAADS